MLDIYNFKLEIFNITKMLTKNRILLIGIILIISCLGLFYFLVINDFDRFFKIIAASIISIGPLILYLVNEKKKKKDKANNIPVDDELTIKSKVYAGNKAFQISMFLWFIIFIFQGSFIDARTMLGVGILGSAAIYGGNLLYFKSTQNFDNSNC